MTLRMAILVCGVAIGSWAWAQGEDDEEHAIHNPRENSVWRIRYQPGDPVETDFPKSERKVFDKKYKGVRVKIERRDINPGDKPEPDDYTVHVKIFKAEGGSISFNNLEVDKLSGSPGGQNRIALRTAAVNYPSGSSDDDATHKFLLFAVWHPGHSASSRRDDTLHLRLVGKPIIRPIAGQQQIRVLEPEHDCEEEPDTDVLEEEEEVP